MALPYPIRDIAPHERRREVAQILTRGLLRWRQRRRADGLDAQARGDPGTCLEVSRETRLSASADGRGLSPRKNGDDA